VGEIKDFLKFLLKIGREKRAEERVTSSKSAGEKKSLMGKEIDPGESQ